MKKNSEIMERLIRNINHEIKNPLTVIRGYAQLLTMKEANAEFQKKTGMYIIENVDLIDERLSGLYRAFNLPSEENVLVNVLDEISSIIEKYEPEKKSRIHIVAEPNCEVQLCKMAFRRTIECLIGGFNWNRNPNSVIEISIKKVNGNLEFFITYSNTDFSNFSQEWFYLPFVDKNVFCSGIEIFEVYCISEAQGWNFQIINDDNKNGFSIRV
ncbi:MAG: hypothetical protein N2316_05800 [Spirochaetes bacterium]|nr:hypothetical protein [Spirochaetota bacterium]